MIIHIVPLDPAYKAGLAVHVPAIARILRSMRRTRQSHEIAFTRRAGFAMTTLPKGDYGMKGKCRVIAVLLGMALMAFIGPAVYAQSDQMKLDHPEAFGKKQRPPVVFPHNRHVEANLSCKDCHHRYEQGKNVLDEGELEEGKPGIRCSECHDAKSRPRLREVFHNLCIGCHAAKRGPRLCGECHVRK